MAADRWRSAVKSACAASTASGLACSVRGPVDAGHRVVAALAAAGGDDQVGLDLFDGLPERAAAEHGVEHVVGDDRVPAASLALADDSVELFEGGLVAARAFGLGHRGDEREQ
ncbi:hypothetical protein ACFO4E_09975 [Nocardiopsis mangrovi]|uniref:Uncharacterized protein n=1 Tax=Nocardiopsis mangrovi TaxID=1179818 RepID=A0ABV9DX70_9ACTN